MKMVLQGKTEEKKVWAIPSGGKEQEAFDACCIREIKEETESSGELHPNCWTLTNNWRCFFMTKFTVGKKQLLFNPI
ncbi:hypothetical protein COJ27_29910 [Bacillus cereus]|uniref:NUDIX hydrolase n=1 Tax=Bacillus cereus TaxID=1396 RepID=UPI000BF62BD2|nr:NUDIX hydrolase [Bacillus cereus]PFL57217.1 hypothetical protein COJ27_29910 [Bacillus cereus]